MSLRLRCPINTKRAVNIVKRAERSLLTERVRVVNKLSWLESRRTTLEGSMDQVLSNEDKVSVLSHLSIVKEKQFVSCQNNQKAKFDRLLNKSKQQSADNSIDLSGEQLKKWVVNISKYKLSEPETSVSQGTEFRHCSVSDTNR